MPEIEKSSPKPAGKPDNVFLSLIFNLALPVILLTRLSKDPMKAEAPFYAIGPEWALCIACLFPLGYGIYDYMRRGKVNWMSVLGLIVVMVKGVFGLFKLAPIWFACSEATLPLLFGAAILFSMRSKPPMVQKLLLNPDHIDMDRVHSGLKEQGNEGKLGDLMVHASGWFSLTMLASALMNFFLVLAVIKTNPHTDYEAYVQEIGKFTGLQYPIIALPLGIGNIALLWWVLHQLKKLTGHGFSQLMINAPDDEPASESGEK